MHTSGVTVATRGTTPTRSPLTWLVGLPLLVVSFLLGLMAPRINPHDDGEWQALDTIKTTRESWLNPVSKAVEVYVGPAWSPWVILAAAVVIFLFRRRFIAVTFALVTGLAWLPGHFVKDLAHRPRPDHLDAMTSYADNMSMPSGHTGIVAAITIGACLVAANEHRRYRWIVVVGVLATLFVGYFRMYAAAHYPLDVLVGGALAAGTGLALWRPALALNRRVNRGGGFWALPPGVNPETAPALPSRAAEPAE